MKENTDPNVLRALEKLRLARKSIDKAMTTLITMVENGVSSQDMDSARTVARRWVREDKAGVESVDDDFQTDAPELAQSIARLKRTDIVADIQSQPKDRRPRQDD